MKQGITAEQVRRGMVFENHVGDRFIAGVPAQSGVWKSAEPGKESDCAALMLWDRMLGCDPAIAARADCEEFGIAPGCDAAAHGFARTREGGVVDLRRAASRPGWCVRNDGSPHRVTMMHRQPFALVEGQGFVGLDARYVSPEDLRRLCCGAKPTTWTAQMTATMQSVPRNGFGCTLAIGDHAEHEDIAAGVKWPATMTGTWSSGMAGAPVAHVGALVNDGSGDMRPAQPASGASFAGR